MYVATFVAWALQVKCARSVRVKIAEEVLPEEILQCGFDSAACEVNVHWWQAIPQSWEAIVMRLFVRKYV